MAPVAVPKHAPPSLSLCYAVVAVVVQLSSPRPDVAVAVVAAFVVVRKV